MSRIFISYRRDEAEHPASRLADDLRREFGEERVFHDIGSIDPGADFVEVLQRALETCAAVVVVIGRNWLTVTDRKGRRRLDNPDDWVRQEVAESLKRPGVRVFPVLVDDADMPDAENLPEPLLPITRRQAFPMTVRHWANDAGRLVAFLKKVPGLADGGAAEASRSSSPAAGASVQAEARPVPACQPTQVVAPSQRVQAANSPAPGVVFRDRADCPQMVVIPAGSFVMGSGDDERGRQPHEGPQHAVTIAHHVAVGKYPVTFDEWDAFVLKGGTRHKPKDHGWGRGRQPVIDVSWEEAQRYVAWLAKRTGKPYRLLTEAEWEYAARAGTQTCFPWGDEPGTNRANFYGSGSPWSGEQASPAGSFEANGFGLHDMIGNVWEWVADCWNDTYDRAPSDGSAWVTGDCSRRVARGGSWYYGPEDARAAIRIRYPPGYRDFLLGFRIARTL